MTANFFPSGELSGWETVDVKEDSVEYDCPKCGEKIFDNRDDAEKFLKGEG